MNAFSLAQDNARNIAILERLAELGMQLAELAAAEALRGPTAADRRSDPRLLFIRLSAMVQGCIADRARLAASQRKAGSNFNEICQAFGISYETGNLPMH